MDANSNALPKSTSAASAAELNGKQTNLSRRQETVSSVASVMNGSTKNGRERSIDGLKRRHPKAPPQMAETMSSGANKPESETAPPENWSANGNVAKSDTCLPTASNFHLGQALEMTRPILVGAFMALFVTVVQLYTWITLPIYFFSQKPWQRRARSTRNRVKRIASLHSLNPNNGLSLEEEEEDCLLSETYVRDYAIHRDHEIIKLNTVTEMLDMVAHIHGANSRALGYRQVLSEEESLDEQGNSRRIDGRQLKQYRLSPNYTWMTYGQVDTFTKNLAQSLYARGIASFDKVLIISETRVEWMLCAQAIIRTGATIVTLFSNLGVDGVAHGILETQVSTVFASIDCLPLLEKVLKRDGHSVRQVIYIDGYRKPDLGGFGDNIDTVALSELEQIGKKAIKDGTARPLHRASADDLMIIMYTSGTTGTPKAALMTHRQFTASVQALYPLVEEAISTAPEHTYISYLPMAHVLELTVESFFFFGGVKIGYGSPFTLTDSAPGLAPGQKCDIKLLRPTVITAVPLVLDRILKEVNEKLRSRTPVSEPVFKFLMDYKSSWTKRGYECNIVRKLLCKKVQEQLGGHLKYMIVGGAPLSGRTQATIKSALDITLIQGYGATETTGAALAMDFHDLSYGCVGAPLGGVKLRLKDWPEGGYSIRDKPFPRGEILIGGPVIARGYYKLPRQTEEAFFTDRMGCRWFRTGDIGLVNSNGTVKIIDRCKDLIKLQNGEYISLGKVESALKGCQYVDNICVYGGAFSASLVAIVSPNKKALSELAQQLGKAHLSTLREQCDDGDVEQEIYEEIGKTAKTAGLSKKEIPVRIKVVPDDWNPDNGTLTAALKLKRKMIETNYKKELEELYEVKRKSKVVGGGKHSFDQNNNDLVESRKANGNGFNESKVTFQGNGANGSQTQITMQPLV